MSEESNAYWRANIRLVTISLIIWALVSFGAGIVFRPLLAGITVGGTDLGFWFAQQGSILVFIVLIFFYAWRMNSLDRKFGVGDDGPAAQHPDERPAIHESDRGAAR